MLIFFIADSLGSLDLLKQLKSIKIQGYLERPMGIHTHDNMGKALENSIAAITILQWIDSTVTGMGRGPGNTKQSMQS